MAKKYVYFFGNGKAEGSAQMRDLLGGKGANLAEMTNLGIPVPAGFTITTEVCMAYYKNNRNYPDGLREQVMRNMANIEEAMGAKFGDSHNPLLVSVRSGARVSMPGMMDTVLNIGLNDETIKGLISQTNDSRASYDCYRRFVQMYGNVVLGVEGRNFELLLEKKKEEEKIREDTALSADALKELVGQFKEIVKKERGEDFPEDPQVQLWGAIGAVFLSWNTRRAQSYRKINRIPDDWGTAVNIQSMVFGNMGETSATGVAFTRDPATGENTFYGEYLINAQGEDVVAGIRTPHPLSIAQKGDSELSSLEEEMPEIYKQLEKIRKKLEKRYQDIQDIEFTIQKGKLWMLQTRAGKRTAVSAVRVAVEMVEEELIDKETALLRVGPEQLSQLLHRMFDPKAKREVIAKGLPASPGAASGKVVFNADEAEKAARKGEKLILVRTETSPEDINGMVSAQGILTARGGMTCIAGDVLLLTDKGFFTAEKAFNKLKNNENINILSYDASSSLAKWKRVVAAGRRRSKVIKIKVSQTGRTRHNFLRITPDHKMYSFQNRKLIKKRLKDILNDEEYICLIDKIPQLKGQSSFINDERMSYLVGAILTDGYIKLKKTKGYVTFTQKKNSDKEAFIEQVNSYFYRAFGTKFSPPRTKISGGYLGGRYIHGEVIDLISSKKKPAEILTNINDNLVSWALGLSEVSSLNFLAGAIDGDGTFHSYENNRIMLYVSKEPLAQAIVVTCLKLGIVPQITVNRNIYNIQILEKLDKILSYTKRVKGSLRKRVYGTKLFAARSLFSDIIDEVNFMGRPRECLKRNLLIDVEKIRRDILSICSPNPVRPQLEKVLNSNLRMYRVKKVKGKKQTAFVYNFEVDSPEEIDKNYIVFTKMYTPLVVSNSHAAVVARGMGKCCVAGCEEIKIDYAKQEFRAKDLLVKRGDYISLDGTSGEIMRGEVPTMESEITQVVKGSLRAEESSIYPLYHRLMSWANEVKRLGVRANADTPQDAKLARDFGAEGIGLARTEHMFFGEDRIPLVRALILADNIEDRTRAIESLLPLQRGDFKGILKAMDNLPVIIRLLDPPLHEFLPPHEELLVEITRLKATKGDTKRTEELEKLLAKVTALQEFNPMLGHRGCRLGVTFPEIYQMQVRAIFEATCELIEEGYNPVVEVMIPLVGHINELKITKRDVCNVAEEVLRAKGVRMKYMVGTMIELPRAALTADEIAEEAEFFSYGTNDLTQTTFGFSRDDIEGKFLPVYIDKKVLEVNPFAVLDQKGVGELIRIGIEKGRKVRPEIEIGICGEHGGEPTSVEFCHRVGMSYVSCSPFRVPIARLAAAQAALKS